MSKWQKILNTFSPVVSFVLYCQALSKDFRNQKKRLTRRGMLRVRTFNLIQIWASLWSSTLLHRQTYGVPAQWLAVKWKELEVRCVLVFNLIFSKLPNKSIKKTAWALCCTLKTCKLNSTSQHLNLMAISQIKIQNNFPNPTLCVESVMIAIAVFRTILSSTLYCRSWNEKYS